MTITNKSINDNHCTTCIFSIPQDESSSYGAVDCLKRGYGNVYSSDIHPCENYRERECSQIYRYKI